MENEILSLLRHRIIWRRFLLFGMRSGTAQIFYYITLREESVDEGCTQKSFCIREWEIHGIELSGILLSVEVSENLSSILFQFMEC